MNGFLLSSKSYFHKENCEVESQVIFTNFVSYFILSSAINSEYWINPDSNSLSPNFYNVFNLCFVFSLPFYPSLFLLFNSPGTWASLVPFQVSNRTPIMPTNVPNYALNIIGEPFLQAETSNWGKKIIKKNKSKIKKRRKERKTVWEKKPKKEEKVDQQLQLLQSIIPLRLKLKWHTKGRWYFTDG